MVVGLGGLARLLVALALWLWRLAALLWCRHGEGGRRFASEGLVLRSRLIRGSVVYLGCFDDLGVC